MAYLETMEKNEKNDIIGIAIITALIAGITCINMRKGKYPNVSNCVGWGKTRNC